MGFLFDFFLAFMLCTLKSPLMVKIATSADVEVFFAALCEDSSYF